MISMKSPAGEAGGKEEDEKMKKKLAALILICAVCLAAAVPALAADVFAYAERSISLFEGEEATPVIDRAGKYEYDGTVTYKADSEKICTVDADGTITAVKKGNTNVTATLKVNGKAVKKTIIQVRVIRPVTKVTLSTKNLQVFEPDDPDILPLLKIYQEKAAEEEPEEPETPEGEEPEYPEIPEIPEGGETEEEPLLTDRILVIPVGKSVTLNATCTPEDANNKKIEYETSDAGIAKLSGERALRGMQAGECDLTIRSAQNPEVFERFHVLVTEPVKKIAIDAPFKTLSVGSSMQLDPVFTPADASIQKVEWSSRSPKLASVTEDGTVTGLSKGKATIEVKAMDGSGMSGTVVLDIIQDVTEVTINKTDVTVAAGRYVEVKGTALPKEASIRSLTWYSSDESIATVKNGQITGKKAGECTVTCASTSNPDVTASIPVTVIQLAKRVSFMNTAIDLPVRTSFQLEWEVGPEDTTIMDVTFRSSNTKIATVDENGTVYGISRGAATITVTTADGSNRQATCRVNVIQPVEGIDLPAEQYYVQAGRATDIQPTILPKNANNQKVYWSIDDDSIATARAYGVSVGRVTGRRKGTTTVTATTDDGGFTASSEIVVDDFDEAVMVESVRVENNKVKLVLRNLGNYTLKKVYFKVDCYDTQGYPLICNKDWISTWFNGDYPLELEPGSRTQHGMFNFNDYMETGIIGYVTVTVTGYEFESGQRWTIPEDYQIPSQPAYSNHMWEPTPSPVPNEEEDYDDYGDDYDGDYERDDEGGVG